MDLIGEEIGASTVHRAAAARNYAVQPRLGILFPFSFSHVTSLLLNNSPFFFFFLLLLLLLLLDHLFLLTPL